MRNRIRVTVTVEPELVEAGNRAVAAGQANSLSAWVSAALAEHVARARRLNAMASAIAAYEREFGAITMDEAAPQARADQREARVVRGTPKGAA